MKLNKHESGAGPNLVLIHGWAMNPAVWDGLMTELVQSYRVICVELPGHGVSDYALPWTLDEVLQALSEQLPECCSIVGWSLGGMLALAYAQRYPKRVDRLVMMASSAKFVQAENWECAQQESVLAAFIKGLESKASMTIKRFLSLQTQGLAQAKEINRQLKDILAKGGEGLYEGLLSGLKVLQQADLRLALLEMTSPVLMILGAKDQLVPLAAGEASLKINPHIQLSIINEASHVPFLSHQAEVVEAIKQFIVTKEYQGE